MIATPSSALGKLPPSVRDFQIYRFVKLECNSTRAAALEFLLSQTRVRQIIARVVEFLLESAPRTAGDEATDARMVVAQQLAREQLEHLYARAIRTFNDTEREDVHGNLLPGKVSFLVAAARISLWMAKVPVHGVPAFRDDEDGDTAETNSENSRIAPSDAEVVRIKQEMAAWERTEARSPQVNPPNVDCSVAPVSRSSLLRTELPNAVASVSAEGTYKTLGQIKTEARQQFLVPAQMAGSPAVNPPPPDEVLSQAGDAHATHRPLNRKERRARERLRQRLLAKKR